MLQEALKKFDELLEYLLYNSSESINVVDYHHVFYRYQEEQTNEPKFTIEIMDKPAKLNAIISSSQSPHLTFNTVQQNIIYVYDTYISFDNTIRYESHAYTRHLDRMTELAMQSNVQLINDAVGRFGVMCGFSRYNKITNLTKE